MTDQEDVSKGQRKQLQTLILRKLEGDTEGLRGQARLRQRFATYPDEVYDEAIRDLEQNGFITRTGSGYSAEVLLTPAGRKEEAHRAGLLTVDQLAGLLTIEKADALLEELRKQLDEASSALAQLKKAAQDSETKQEELKKQIEKSERDFYSKLVPFFAAFISAFALIIASVQRLIQQGTAYTVTAADDPLRVAWLSIAIIGPLGLVLLVFVGLVWLTVWSATRR
jgi:hypothetical protein